MSRWVDMDACPCRDCKDMANCDNKVTPWCDKYAEWYAGADVAPVKRGHWKKDYINDCARCSNCGRACYQMAKDHCAYCGAEMARSVVVSDMERTTQ